MTNQFEPAIDWNAYTEDQVMIYRTLTEYYLSETDFDTYKTMSTEEVTAWGVNAHDKAITLLNKIIAGEPYTVSDELLLFMGRKRKLRTKVAIEKVVRGVTN